MSEKNVFQKRAAEIAGVSCLALALFLLLALLSYHPLDPSLRHYYGPDSISIRNLTGSVGSYTADTLIWIMGFGIVWLPAMLLVVALRYFREPQFRIGATVATGTIGLVFATSGLFGLLIGNVTDLRKPSGHGGADGHAHGEASRRPSEPGRVPDRAFPDHDRCAHDPVRFLAGDLRGQIGGDGDDRS